MKLHLPLSLYKTLLIATGISVTLGAGVAEAGVIRHDYAMQQYKDFAMNMGQFRPGATNIDVFRTDGTSTGVVIPLMPSMASYAAYWHAKRFAGSNTDRSNGGATLISPHYIITAAHCGYADAATDINFLCSSASTPDTYPAGVVYKGTAGYGSYTSDGLTQRLSKIVTDVAYTPLCTDTDLISGLATSGAYLYRAGNGKTSMALASGGNATIAPGSPLGGMVKVTNVLINYGGTGSYAIKLRLNQTESMPLTIGLDSGDSGSPVYFYNEETQRFETVGIFSTGTFGGYGNVSTPVLNPAATLSVIDSFTQAVDLGGSGDTLTWGAQNSEDGTGTLSQGENSWSYIGSNADGSNPAETRDLLFSSTAETQRIELAANVNMGTAAIEFDHGNYVLASQEGSDFTITNSAGFIVNAGASVTTTLNGQGEEWRKVGEGVMTISGSGDNNISLNVGGGYMSFDEQGNIIHRGEVRLDREGGYAATNITLSAGVASIVLMRDGQINGNNFTFGHMGGVLNLNGHDLTWSTINTNALARQQGSEYGATIANVAPEGLAAPGLATFTYTGNGTYKGAFEDGGSEAAGLLKVVYNAATATDTWVLTGTHNNQGGFEANSGNLTLQGSLTLHTGSVGALTTIAGDYTYAVMDTSKVSVNNGATFTLADHALLKGDVEVNNGTFVLRNTVNAAMEYVGGSNLREDVTGIRSHLGSVNLTSADATMRVDISSATDLHYQSDIHGAGNFEKTGTGRLLLSGNNDFAGSKTITRGTVEFLNAGALGDTSAEGGKWNIGEEGVMLVSGQNGSAVLPHVDSGSTGVLAMDADQQTALDVSGHAGLFLGAAEGKTIEYGTLGTTEALTATEGAWRFGGGGGTLNVNFRLTGAGDLIIGNAFSNGTVHLANTSNDFEGDILIGGFNNYLTFSSVSALGNARVAVNYGNILGLPEASEELMGIIKSGSEGVLALYAEGGTVSRNLDFVNDYAGLAAMALGSAGETHYNGTLSTNGSYRFGGSGTLHLDTVLTGSGTLQVDAQGLSGGGIVLHEANTFSGSVIVGGKLNADSTVETGSIDLVLGHENALSAASSVTLEAGGVLALKETNATLHNLVANTGASLVNRGSETHRLTIDNNADATFAAGVLGAGNARLDIEKAGSGTLTLNTNSAYEGDIYITGGTVKGSSSSATSSSFGSQAAGNRIIIGENGTLALTLYGSFGNYQSAYMAQSRLYQTVTGTGTLEVSANQRSVTLYPIPGLPITSTYTSNKTLIVLSQEEAFEGTLKVKDNTRVLIGSNLSGCTNLGALDTATIVVESGSQAVVTDRISGNGAANAQHSYANFVLNGNTFSGGYGSNYWSTTSNKVFGVDIAGTDGALSVDCGSVVHGNITLASDAAIASRMSNGGTTANAYGNSSLGGTILGTISGEGKTLTLSGNAALTLRADAANSYGDLSITNTAGVKLGSGAAQSTVSTAMGTGKVTLGTSLSFANAGTSDNSITYRYGNDIEVRNAATLNGSNNTTELTGLVTLLGAGMNLSTAEQAQLNLLGGISGGTGTTVSIAAGSHIGIGGEAGSFSGNINAGAGAELSLLSAGALSAVTLGYTDSLTLALGADTAYTINALAGTGTADAEGVAGPTALTLAYDFTSGSSNSSLCVTEGLAEAFSTATIRLELNLAQDLRGGTYTLLTNDVTGLDISLADDLNGRITLRQEASGLYMDVTADERLFWTQENSGWDTTDASWELDGQGSSSYADGKGVVFGSTGVAEDNSAAAPELITLGSTVNPHSVMVKDETFYRLEGSGAIAGEETSLSVVSGATLHLANSGNTFGGGVLLQEGTLVAGAENSLGNSAISVNESGRLEATAAGALAGNTIAINRSGVLSAAAAGSLSGNTISLAEGGVLHLVAENALGEGNSITFSGGTLRASANNTLGSSATAFASNNARFSVDAGATLTHYAGSGRNIASLEGAGNYVLNATGATTIADMSGFSGTITKTGLGNITVTNKSSEATWEFAGNSWTGALNITNITNGQVKFTGAYGQSGNSYLHHSGTAQKSVTYTQNIEFNRGSGNDSFGLKITNGNSNQPIIFAGTITGNGKFFLDRSSYGTGVTDRFHFTGDLSSFEGGFHYKGTNAASGITLSDNGGATVYANNNAAAGTGDILMEITTPEANKFALSIDYAADHGLANSISGKGNVAKTGAGTVTLTGDLSGHTGTFSIQEGGATLSGNQNLNNTVTVAAGARLHVTEGTTMVENGSITATSAEAADGAAATEAERAVILVSETGALALGARLRVSAQDAGTAAELENISISGSGFTSAVSGTVGAITHAHISIGTISRARAASSDEATSYALTDLDIVSSTIENTGTDTVVFTNTYFTADSRVSNLGSGSVTLDSCTLATGDDALVLQDDAGVGTIRLTNFSNVTLANSLSFELSEATSGSIASNVAEGMTELHIVLTGTTYTPEEDFTLNLNNASLLDIRSFNVSARDENGVAAMDIRLSFASATDSVPEPASATLALLGLAGLALRRRRR